MANIKKAISLLYIGKSRRAIARETGLSEWQTRRLKEIFRLASKARIPTPVSAGSYEEFIRKMRHIVVVFVTLQTEGNHEATEKLLDHLFGRSHPKNKKGE